MFLCPPPLAWVISVGGWGGYGRCPQRTESTQRIPVSTFTTFSTPHIWQWIYTSFVDLNRCAEAAVTFPFQLEKVTFKPTHWDQPCTTHRCVDTPCAPDNGAKKSPRAQFRGKKYRFTCEKRKNHKFVKTVSSKFASVPRGDAKTTTGLHPVLENVSTQTFSLGVLVRSSG